MWFRTLACAVSLLVGISGASPSAAGMKRIAVVPFESTAEFRGTPLSRGLTDMIITELVKLGGVQVIERAQLERLMDEHRLRADGLLDPATAVAAGRVLGVDYLLGGRITEFGVKENRTHLGGVAEAVAGARYKQSTARVVLDLRLVDASTGRILLARSVQAEDRSASVGLAGGRLRDLVLIGNFETTEWAESRIGRATRKAVSEVVQSLAPYFPPVGRVSAVYERDGTRYAILDLGAFAGLAPGRELRIYRETVVRDSEGREVWREARDVGRVRVEDVRNDSTRAVIVTEDPAVQEGDLFTWERQPQPAEERK
jgi:curli biogenesis system outer membrane secretion channel CsgG